MLHSERLLGGAVPGYGYHLPELRGRDLLGQLGELLFILQLRDLSSVRRLYKLQLLPCWDLSACAGVHKLRCVRSGDVFGRICRHVLELRLGAPLSRHGRHRLR